MYIYIYVIYIEQLVQYHFQFISTSYCVWRQMILVGIVTIAYYIVVQEYQHAFGR